MAPPKNPPFAKFMGVGVFVPDTAITPHCRICFSDKLKFLRVPPAELKSGAPASSSGSDDDSTVTSVSMESDDAPGVVPMAKDEVIESFEDDEPLRGTMPPLWLYPPLSFLCIAINAYAAPEHKADRESVKGLRRIDTMRSRTR